MFSPEALPMADSGSFWKWIRFLAMAAARRPTNVFVTPVTPDAPIVEWNAS